MVERQQFAAGGRQRRKLAAPDGDKTPSIAFDRLNTA
jgi:hypothetical protein